MTNEKIIKEGLAELARESVSQLEASVNASTQIINMGGLAGAYKNLKPEEFNRLLSGFLDGGKAQEVYLATTRLMLRTHYFEPEIFAELDNKYQQLSKKDKENYTAIRALSKI